MIDRLTKPGMWRNLSSRIGKAGLALLLLVCAVQAAHGENFTNFGQQPNFCINNQGVCFAAEAINSFIYLENQYPNIYGTKLTPGVKSAKPPKTDRPDTTAFANMVGPVFANTAGYNSFLAGKMAWFAKNAPGTTRITSEYVGSASNNSLPTFKFLSGEIQSNEDVELFITGGGIGHAIDLVSISCGPPYNVCGMQYQDPNVSTKLQPFTQLTAGPGGALLFYGLPYYASTPFTIQAAFSESPIPEPGTLLMFGSGIISLAGVLRRRINS